MENNRKAIKCLSILFVVILLASCAPKISFFVTRPPILPIENVETISMGFFENELGASIALPPSLKGKRFDKRSSIKPTVAEFRSNANAAELIRAKLIADLSHSGQYKIISTGGSNSGFSGIIPDAGKTGVVNGLVRYYEFSGERAEKMFYLLLATKGGLDLRETAMLMAAKVAVTTAAEKGRKGFNVATPFIEKIAAMEVEFDLVRQSNGKKIVRTQTIRSYFVQKWGGKNNTSHLPRTLHHVIVTNYRQDASMLDRLSSQAETVELALLDPHEFLARGGKLKKNPSIPKNSLDIKIKLAEQIVAQYIRLISQYTEETTLEVASGDAIGTNFISGNAYEKAINRLENIERSEEDSFNLALAYESVAEYNQAAKYYKEALSKSPGNATYLTAIKRVTRQ